MQKFRAIQYTLVSREVSEQFDLQTRPDLFHLSAYTASSSIIYSLVNISQNAHQEDFHNVISFTKLTRLLVEVFDFVPPSLSWNVCTMNNGVSMLTQFTKKWSHWRCRPLFNMPPDSLEDSCHFRVCALHTAGESTCTQKLQLYFDPLYKSPDHHLSSKGSYKIVKIGHNLCMKRAEYHHIISWQLTLYLDINTYHTITV